MNDNEALYPNCPGHRAGAPETSREAAETLAPVAGPIRDRCFAVVRAARDLGVIADDVAERLDLNVYQVRARLSELRASGRIVDSDRRRRGSSGRRAAIWVLPEFGPPPPPDPQGDMLAA